MSQLFEDFKKHIASKETKTGEDYEAANPKSSARGKYQFLASSPSTRAWEKQAGLSGPEDWVISAGDSEQDKKRKARNQEKLLKTAFDNDYKPNIDAIVEASGGELDKVQAAALQHFQGLGKAKQYAKTGQEPDDPNNVAIKKYLDRSFADKFPTKTKEGALTEYSSPEQVNKMLKDIEIESQAGMEDKIREGVAPRKSSEGTFMDNVSDSGFTDVYSPDRRQKINQDLEQRIQKGAEPATLPESFAKRFPTSTEGGALTEYSSPDQIQARLGGIEKEAQDTMMSQIGKGTSSDKKAPVDEKSTPKQMESSIKKIESDAKKELPKTEFEILKKKLDAIDEAYNKNKQDLENKEFRSTMAQAITQLAAGLYGLKTGQNLSGLKFSQTNWEAKLDRALNEMKERKASTRKAFDDAERRRLRREQLTASKTAKQEEKLAKEEKRKSEQEQKKREQLDAAVEKMRGIVETEILKRREKGESVEDQAAFLKSKLGLERDVEEIAKDLEGPDFIDRIFFGEKDEPIKIVRSLVQNQFRAAEAKRRGLANKQAPKDEDTVLVIKDGQKGKMTYANFKKAKAAGADVKLAK